MENVGPPRVGSSDGVIRYGNSRGRENGFGFDRDCIPVDHWRCKSFSRHGIANSSAMQVLNFQPNEAARILALQKKIKLADK